MLENGDVFFLVSVGDYPDHRLRPVIFDPATRTWRRGVRAPDIRIFPALAPLPDGSVLVSGGAFDVADGPPSPDSITWRYDISNDSWSKLAKTPLETVDWSGYAMPDGDVLLVGDGTPQRYHPATNSWTVLATPTVYRYIGGTIRLLDGRILGAGSNGCFDGSEESEIFDPVANTWTAAGSVAPGDGSTLVLLRDGRVAMVGGYWECQPYYVHELYPNVSVLDPSAIH